VKSVVNKTAGILLLFLLITSQANSQYYSTGQDPASIHWRQIKTPKYQLIYPSSFEKKAQYLANIMDLLVKHETTTLKANVPRIPIVLHTQTTISNGVTVWAPKRIEMYTCSPQITYSEEWLEQLAIHEYRHAVQISKMNQGFTKALYFIFGQQATGGILGLYIPAWFLEGDATVTETALSKSGRGRSALFESVLRAQVLEQGIYSYDRAVLGSYKYYIPNAYELGYFVVGQSRKRHGSGFWNRPLDQTAKYPFMVVPFATGIKKNSSITKVRLYKESLSTLDSGWRVQEKATQLSAFRYITKGKKYDFSVYTHPLFLNDSTLIADKSSMDDIDRFVMIDLKTGKEKRLLTPGSHISGTISLAGDLLVWSEQEPDHRWQNEDYAEIKMYNFKTRKIRDLTAETRYFAPIVSPDGNRVAAVYVSPENDCAIHILETGSGKLIQQLPMEEGTMALTPNWSSDGNKIVFTRLNEKGETISIIDIHSGKTRNILPFTYNEILGPAFFFRHYIIYSCDYSGIENLYAVDTLSLSIFQLTSSKFASMDPDFSSDRSTMVYSDYTSEGLMIVEAKVDTSSWIPFDRIEDHSVQLSEFLARQENCNIQDSTLQRNIYKMNNSDHYDLKRDSIDGTLYPSKKYSRGLHLFNPHSWAPVSFDVNNLTVNPGVSVLSQNVLSTTFVGAGYEYNVNEMTGNFYANITYAGWYPVFNFQVDYGNRASLYNDTNTGKMARFTWMETNLAAKINIPWNFSHGRFYRYVKPSIGTTLTNSVHNSSTPAHFISGWTQSMDYALTASQYSHSVERDIYPKWGQAIALNFRNTPFSGNDLGSIAAFQANLYFPGFFNHHSFWCYGGVQQREVINMNSYRFGDIISYPWGYDNQYDAKLFSLKFNYTFPFLYPDLSLGSLFYFKRFKLNLFFDYAEGFNPDNLNIYKSTGAELTIDMHILRFTFPVELGVRSIYFPDSGTWGFEFLYSINY
jgi:hypothetical protein